MAVEERRLAPFPGKLRPAAVGKKLQGEGRSFRESSRLAALAAPRHRTNRAFGTTRSTNVNLQRPTAVDSKSLKQSKPVAISRRPPHKDATKIEFNREPTGASGDQEGKDATSKPKSEANKSAVRFQDQERPVEKNIRKSPIPEEGPLTPKSLIKSALLGTPYFSAKSCSKCRFDKLEYAPYWLTQIKLAESVGKHFASAAFFRLAFECNAEPMRSLKSELKRYLARHSSLPIRAMWKEVSRDYGLLGGEPNLGLISFVSVAASAEGKQSPRSSAQKGKLELGGMPQHGPMRKPTKNSDPVSLDMNSIAEEPLLDITAVNGDSDDATKSISIPYDETLTKEMIDDVNAVDTSDHEDPLTATSPGKEEVVVEKSDWCSGSSVDASLTPSKEALKDTGDDASAVDSSGHKDSMTGTSTADEAVIEKSDGASGFSVDDSSTTSKEVRTGKSVDGSTTASDKSKSTSDFRGKRTGKTRDEVNKSQNIRLGKKINADKNINRPTNGTRNAAILVKMR